MEKKKRSKRLSMKLLYKVLADFGALPAMPNLSGLGQVRRFIDLVEKELKP